MRWPRKEKKKNVSVRKPVYIHPLQAQQYYSWNERCAPIGLPPAPAMDYQISFFN